MRGFFLEKKMDEMLDPIDIANVKTDLEDIGKSGNIVGVIVPRYGDPYNSVPLAVKNIENKGGYISAPSLSALQLLAPEYNHQVGRDDSTGDEYRWNPNAVPTPQWEPTGRNYIRDATIYADAKTVDTPDPSLYYFYDKSGNIFGTVLDDATFELDNFKTSQLRETLLNVINSFFTSNSTSPLLIADKGATVILEIGKDGIADSIDPTIIYSLQDVYANNMLLSDQARFLEVSDLRKSKLTTAYKFNVELAPYGIDGTLHQRMAAAIKLREGKLILLFSQFSTANSDAQDGRLVYRFIDYDLKNKTASASQTFPLHGNKTGSLSRHPNVVKQKYFYPDRITCVFNSNNGLLKTHSDDFGQTWSVAQDISPLAFPKYLGMGALVEMQDEDYKGRLVLAAYDTSNNIGCLISKDGGATWVKGATFNYGSTVANEVAVTEEVDGSLIFVVRTESDNPNVLRYLISKDGGETLETHVISEKVQTSICQIDILQVANHSKKCVPKVLVCHPQNGGYTRQKFRILVSYDKCQSYSYSYAPYVDSLNVGYSTLLHLGNDDYVCINEQGVLNQQQSVYGFFFNSSEIIKNG